MQPIPPRILASHRAHYWTLDAAPTLDGLGFAEVGAGSLLLIAMHIQDERPWTAARNPLLFGSDGPGFIDLETKRILGKRQRAADGSETPLVGLDPLPLILARVGGAGHDFFSETIHWPALVKEPGKLLPRELVAEIRAETTAGALRIFARNVTEISQCLHAELLALFALGAELSARGVERLQSFTLHSTLKPCRMCAAFLEHVKTRTDTFAVSYDADDPGPLAANTCLDRRGYSVIPE